MIKARAVAERYPSLMRVVWTPHQPPPSHAPPMRPGGSHRPDGGTGNLDSQPSSGIPFG